MRLFYQGINPIKKNKANKTSSLTTVACFFSAICPFISVLNRGVQNKAEQSSQTQADLGLVSDVQALRSSMFLQRYQTKQFLALTAGKEDKRLGSCLHRWETVCKYISEKENICVWVPELIRVSVNVNRMINWFSKQMNCLSGQL